MKQLAVAMNAMELRLGEVGEVYHRGAAGKLAWAAKGLSAGGALLLAKRGAKSRRAASAKPVSPAHGGGISAERPS